MKNIFLWVSLLASLNTFGQKEVIFPKTGETFPTRPRVPGLIITLLAIDTIIIVDNPAYELTPCDAGPEIRRIRNITTTDLFAKFYGINVNVIAWEILKDGVEVRNGKIKPDNSDLHINYNTLQPGNYKLKLKGLTCEGESEMEFEIPGEVDDMKPCPEGPHILEIANTTVNSLDVIFHGINVKAIDWEITLEKDVKRSGNVKPESSVIQLSYDLLRPGKYTLRFSGSTCFGTSSKTFEIKSMEKRMDVKFEDLKPCDAGPELRSVIDISKTELTAIFHGSGVYGLDWEISNGLGVIRSGAIKPDASALRLKYNEITAGDYTLKFSGNTCKGESQIAFTISENPKVDYIVPNPGVADRAVFELFMNINGYGFNSAMPTGLMPEFTQRIDAFQYSWGWGITGIRIWLPWHQWEPTQGVYAREGLGKIIEYCKKRGLKLSIHFLPYRLIGDGFIPSGHEMLGHRGTPFNKSNRMASFASDVVNAEVYVAVRELSKQLATYEGGYYLSLGSGTTEEFINPVVNMEFDNPELTGWEGISQEKFRQFLTSKGRAFKMPRVIEHWPRYVGLDMTDEIGKDFARFISLQLTNYFDNFSKAVKEGSSGKVLSCYLYPDAGNMQNTYELHANFASQAKTADALYGSDGTFPFDSYKKRLVNAISHGMQKVSIVEWDPVDLGQKSGYCSELDYEQLERDFAEAYADGVKIVSLALAYCVQEIQTMEPRLKKLQETYIGKPYVKPEKPYTVVPIADNFFAGRDIYAPFWTGSNYLVPDDSSFWGFSKKNR